MARAFVFPGQGSQAVGMGVELAGAFAPARLVFEEVDEALGQNLSKLMAGGPEDQLVLTENAQPALMAVSMAVVRVLEVEGGLRLADQAKFVAGHSLGEYSALAAAGALSISDAARLLKIRGQAMQQAVPVGGGGMAALLGADMETAQRLSEAASEGEVCVPANDNATGQIVLSGAAGAIDRVVALAPDHGVKKAIKLQVSAPFHCPMMAPAAEIMEDALGKVEISAPSLPLIANVTAAPVEAPDEIRELLVRQVTAMVRWRESVLCMRDADVDSLVELGGGNVLSVMVRRIDKAISGTPVGTPAEVDAFLGSL